MYCIVLMEWSLLPNALRPFKIYCAPPNLGITRTWICRLNIAQRPIFSGFWFFSEPEISQSGPSAYSPSRRNCAQDFYVLKKSIDLSRIWTREPWTSRRAPYPETSTLPRDHRGRCFRFLFQEFTLLTEHDIEYNSGEHNRFQKGLSALGLQWPPHQYNTIVRFIWRIIVHLCILFTAFKGGSLLE